MPGNWLEAVKGNCKAQFSIQINEHRHVCFRWADGEARDVEIVNYHCAKELVR